MLLTLTLIWYASIFVLSQRINNSLVVIVVGRVMQGRVMQVSYYHTFIKIIKI